MVVWIFFTKECAGCGGRWRVLLQQFIVDGLTTDELMRSVIFASDPVAQAKFHRAKG